MPQNKELMRVFRDLDIVEQMGSGVNRILQAYPPSINLFSLGAAALRDHSNK